MSCGGEQDDGTKDDGTKDDGTKDDGTKDDGTKMLGPRFRSAGIHHGMPLPSGQHAPARATPGPEPHNWRWLPALALSPSP